MIFHESGQLNQFVSNFKQLLQICTKMIGFKFDFSKIFWEGAHPSPDASPAFSRASPSVRASPSIRGRFALSTRASPSILGRFFVKLSILSVYDTYRYQLLIHVYKEIKNISPAGSQYYTENSTIHKHYTRQNSNLHLPLCITSLKRNTMSFQGPILWNALPDNIKSCQSLNIFKRKLKLFLLSELL